MERSQRDGEKFQPEHVFHDCIPLILACLAWAGCGGTVQGRPGDGGGSAQGYPCRTRVEEDLRQPGTESAPVAAGLRTQIFKSVPVPVPVPVPVQVKVQPNANQTDYSGLYLLILILIIFVAWKYWAEK